MHVYEKNSLEPIGNFVEIADGYRVNYWCDGPSSKNVVIYVPDAGDTYLQSFQLLKSVAQHARVCSWDRPGRGFSDSPVGAVNETVQLREMKQFLSQFPERGPFVLVGHGYGATLSAVYALQNPDNVKSLILFNPAGTTFYENGGTKLMEFYSRYLTFGEIFSILGATRLLPYLEMFKGWKYDFENVEVAPLLKYNLNQQRVFQLTVAESDKVQPKLISLLKNETTIEKKKFHQPVQIVYSEKYDTSSLMNAEVNNLWSEVVKADTTSWKAISENIKFSNVHGGRDFPMVAFAEANKQIKNSL